MAFLRYSGSRFAQLFSGRKLIILILTVVAFYWLNTYRKNDPLMVSLTAPDFLLHNAAGYSFQLHEVNTPAILVFFNEHEFMANNIYPIVYKRQIPKLKFIQDDALAQVIVVVKGIKTAEEMKKYLADKKYENLSPIFFYTDDSEKNALAYGVRSWPHYFMLDRMHKIRDTAKVISIERVQKQLRSL